jgi:hypothetical protein
VPVNQKPDIEMMTFIFRYLTLIFELRLNLRLVLQEASPLQKRIEPFLRPYPMWIELWLLFVVYLLIHLLLDYKE